MRIFQLGMNMHTVNFFSSGLGWSELDLKKEIRGNSYKKGYSWFNQRSEISEI